MVDQIEYHPGFTQKECVEFCKKNNILVEAWSPLGKGNPMGDADRRAATGKVGYSKPNQGKYRCIRF